jgi:type VI protein secretion system component VasF
MRISSSGARTEIAAIRKLAEVTRSSQGTESEALAEAELGAASDERPRRRSTQLRTSSSAAGDRSSNAVLSALIGLQERK